MEYSYYCNRCRQGFNSYFGKAVHEANCDLYYAGKISDLKVYDFPADLGYHLTPIKRGVFGEISKLEEELAELEDFNKQGNKIGELNELSDLYGAMEGYLEKHHPDTTMDDLKKMAEATKRAFLFGQRKNRDGDNK